ncbi:hypothetical protein SUGI_0539950 [Cryptomeria japonica]|nr:hypothetical protein SUGI_0539950 [Cryptomeria japonica]
MVKMGSWSKDEDDKLIAYIHEHGEHHWKSLPKAAGLRRRVKSCRRRWVNYLKPDLRRGNFSEEEDELIIELQLLWGNKWSRIAARLPGRTDNEIKNHCESTHIKRKLLSRGIDPQSHRTIQPFHSDGSRSRDDRSPSQEISLVDSLQSERCIVTGNFDLAASNGEHRTIQPFHRDDRSRSQEISMVDFFQSERCIVTGNFDLAASNIERHTIQPFHRDDRSLSQEISIVDFFQSEPCIVTSNFDLADSNGASGSEETSDVNLEFTLGLQSSASRANKSQ